jgi:hypothetical protein
MTTTRNKKMRKWLYWVTTFLGMLLTVICVIVIYWLVVPYNWIEADDPETSSEVYEPGTEVIYIYERFCTTQQMDLTVQRYIYSVDTGRKLALLPYSFGADNVIVDCFNDLAIAVPLPKEVGPGEYYIQTDMSYKANPVRRVTQSFITNTFIVEDK